MAKRKVRRSVSRPMKSHAGVHKGHGLLAILTSMFFILFLITVWPSAGDFVYSIHWGWWLALTIIFGISAKMRCCRRM